MLHLIRNKSIFTNGKEVVFFNYKENPYGDTIGFDFINKNLYT